MSRTIALSTIALAVTAVVALAALGTTASSAVAPAGRTSNAASLKAGSSKYGRVLFDGGGRVLYTFARDRGKVSSCYGGCAAAWPPFTVNRAPKAGAGVRGGLLGTSRRRDRSLQVTYGGHPLYYFTGDTRPGQITCQNVSSFGGRWFVVGPNGRPVR